MTQLLAVAVAVVALLSASDTTRTATTTVSVTCGAMATSAADMNTRSGQIEGVGGADAFRTARLADGRWLSLTGDATRPGETLPAYDNTAIVWDRRGQHRIDVPGHYFPRWEDGSEFWPLGMVVSGRTVHVIGARQLTSGAWDWTAMGAYGAVIDVPWCGTPTFVGYFTTPSSGLDDTHVQWSAALTTTSTWTYIHGVLDRPDLFHARDGGYIARAPYGYLADTATWQFWNGSTWADDPAAAVSTIPAQAVDGVIVGGTEVGYTVHQRADGQWQIITKQGGTLANTLGRYTSATPTGPWTWTPLLGVCDLDCYLTGAAPTVPTASGNLLVQWSRTGTYPEWAEVPA